MSNYQKRVDAQIARKEEILSALQEKPAAPSQVTESIRTEISNLQQNATSESPKK